MAVLGMTFAIREWWWLYALGIFAYMVLIPIAEASEQTIIQRVVPYEKQGRVFGFSASVESAATPLSCVPHRPHRRILAHPFHEYRVRTDMFGWLLGDGEARGIALVFVMASALMLVVVLLAFASRPYRLLSQAYADSPPPRRKKLRTIRHRHRPRRPGKEKAGRDNSPTGRTISCTREFTTTRSWGTAMKSTV